MEPSVGIEPTTYRLQGGCSTTELTRQILTTASHGRRALTAANIADRLLGGLAQHPTS